MNSTTNQEDESQKLPPLTTTTIQQTSQLNKKESTRRNTPPPAIRDNSISSLVTEDSYNSNASIPKRDDSFNTSNTHATHGASTSSSIQSGSNHSHNFNHVGDNKTTTKNEKSDIGIDQQTLPLNRTSNVKILKKENQSVDTNNRNNTNVNNNHNNNHNQSMENDISDNIQYNNTYHTNITGTKIAQKGTTTNTTTLEQDHDYRDHHYHTALTRTSVFPPSSNVPSPPSPPSAPSNGSFDSNKSQRGGNGSTTTTTTNSGTNNEQQYFYQHDFSKPNNMMMRMAEINYHQHRPPRSSSPTAAGAPLLTPQPSSFYCKDKYINQQEEDAHRYHQFNHEQNVPVQKQDRTTLLGHSDSRGTSGSNAATANPAVANFGKQAPSIGGLSSFYRFKTKTRSTPSPSPPLSSTTNHQHSSTNDRKNHQEHQQRQYFHPSYEESHCEYPPSYPPPPHHHHHHHPWHNNNFRPPYPPMKFQSSRTSSPIPSLLPPPPTSYPITQDTNAALRALIMFEAEVEKQYQKCQRMQQEVEQEKMKYLKELEIAQKKRVQIALEIAGGVQQHRGRSNSGGNGDGHDKKNDGRSAGDDRHHGHGGKVMNDNENGARGPVVTMENKEQNCDDMMMQMNAYAEKQSKRRMNQQQEIIRRGYQNEDLLLLNRPLKQDQSLVEQPSQKHDLSATSSRDAEEKNTGDHHRQASSALDALALACAAEKSLITEPTTTKAAATNTASSNFVASSSNMQGGDDQDKSPRSTLLEDDSLTVTKEGRDGNVSNAMKSTHLLPQKRNDDTEKMSNETKSNVKITNRTKQTYARLKSNHFIQGSGRSLKDGSVGPSGSDSDNGSKALVQSNRMDLNNIDDDIPTEPQQNASSSRILLSEIVAPLNPKDNDLATHHFRNDGSWSGNVTINDVLCGRGGLTNNHGGNVFFRSLVRSRQEAYLFASKRDKALVAHGIVDMIRSLNPPGRFLKKNKNQVWVEIGNKKAREKTSQALREKAPELMEMLQKQDLETGFENHSHYLPSQNSNDENAMVDSCLAPDKKRRKTLNTVNIGNDRPIKQQGKQSTVKKANIGGNIGDASKEGTFFNHSPPASVHDNETSMNLKRKHQVV